MGHSPGKRKQIDRTNLNHCDLRWNLLQLEPWNNMKSNKRWVRTGIALGIAVLGVGAFAAYQLYWLTSAEHSTAQSALAAVDGLQTVNALSDEEFDAKAKQAEEAVDAARDAALTVRDQKVAFALARYLGSIEVEQGAIREENRAQRADADPAGRYLTVGSSLHPGRSAATRSLSVSLHETLD
jgi:hypothetical protein